MKNSHAGFWVGMSVVLIAAVYSVIVFLVKSTWDAAAWILYGFTMAAFLLTAVQCIAVSRSGAGLVLDTALGVVTLIYCGVQFILGGVIGMCLSGIPATPVIVCELVILAAYLLAAFLMYGAQSHSAAQDHNDRQAVQRMRLLESDVQGMAEAAANPEWKQALRKLAEEIHYSDAATLPGLEDVEARIAKNVAQLQDELEDGESDPVPRIEAIRRLIKERDRTAAILRR